MTPTTELSNSRQFPDAPPTAVAITGMPVGSIICYGTSAPPPGWLLCDGAAISKDDYPNLYGVIGANLPDLRSRFVVGAGGAQGLTHRDQNAQGGAEKVTLAVDQLPAHQHEGLAAIRTGWPFGVFNGSSLEGMAMVSVISNQMYGTTQVGQGQPHENRPPYWALTYIIKF